MRQPAERNGPGGTSGDGRLAQRPCRWTARPAGRDDSTDAGLGDAGRRHDDRQCRLPQLSATSAAAHARRLGGDELSVRHRGCGAADRLAAPPLRDAAAVRRSIAAFVAASLFARWRPRRRDHPVSDTARDRRRRHPPAGQAILLDLYPERAAWPHAGDFGGHGDARPDIGPALGGIITDLASWRLGVRDQPAARRGCDLGHAARPGGSRSATVQAIDLLGVLLLSIGVGALQLWLSCGVGQSWLEFAGADRRERRSS